MSVFGRISGHLIRARETALAHDCRTTVERVAIDAVVIQIDLLLIAVRRLHHDTTNREDHP